MFPTMFVGVMAEDAVSKNDRIPKGTVVHLVAMSPDEARTTAARWFSVLAYNDPGAPVRMDVHRSALEKIQLAVRGVNEHGPVETV